MKTYDGNDPGEGARASEKLDGVYARATKDGIFSKSGKPLDLPHIAGRLKRHFRKNPDGELEGEVWRKGEGVEKIAGAVRAGGDAAKKLRLHVFPKDGQKTPLPFGAVRRVKGTPVRTAADVQRVFDRAVKRGAEGIVVRGADGVPVKKKPRADEEYEVIGQRPTASGKNAVLVVKHGGGTFKVQSRPGVDAKAGDRVQVSYSGKTAKGTPKAAVAERVRNDQDFERREIRDQKQMKHHNLNYASPARLLLGDDFPDAVGMPHPCARVMELARVNTEEEVARDRATLKRIAVGATAAGGLAGYVVAKGRANAPVPAAPAVPVKPVKVKPVQASYWAKKRPRVKVRLERSAGCRVENLEEKRDNLSKARDVAIIGGTGAAGVGSLVAAHQVRKVGKKAGDAMGYASSSVARTARQVRENVTPQAVAREGVQMVKRRVKKTAGEYFPTFIKAGKGISRVMKTHLSDLDSPVFMTPARRLGVMNFSTAVMDRSKVRDDGGKWVDHWKVASGMQKGYHADGREAKVGMADPAVLKSLYRKANDVNKWGTRGTGFVKDAADVVAGKPRARDASGRKKKREWEKSWAKDAAKKALIVGGGIGYGIAYKKSPRLRATHDGAMTAAKRVGNDIKDAISHFSTPARRLGIEFATKKKAPEADETAVRSGIIGGAIGGLHGAAAGGISAAHSKEADAYFGLTKRREAAAGHGGVMVLRKGEVKPFKAKGKFGASERLARAEHEGLVRLRKTATRRAAGGGLAGAALLGGLGYASAKIAGDRGAERPKRFSTPASRMLIELDEVAADAGWDIRDPRGKSARVFAPGARKRVRREKTWSEEIGNERKLWKGAVIGAGLAAGAAGVVIGRRMPKRPPAAGAKSLLVKTLKKKRGGLD